MAYPNPNVSAVASSSSPPCSASTSNPDYKVFINYPNPNVSAVASSSSSSPPRSASTSNPDYKVFINHHGRDVKNTFASYLYNKLTKDHGLAVFLDKDEMKVGQPVKPQLQAAIEVASAHVAIFSPNYAESKWCLDELVLMENSKGTIIPVFYNVETKNVKSGTYFETLNKQEKDGLYHPNTFQVWKDCLKRVGGITGLELNKFQNEADLLDRVVESVVSVVEKGQKPPLGGATHPIGLDGKLQDFERKVLSQQQNDGKARVVGIIGTGGVGKTTLAIEFFNFKRSDYSWSSFLSLRTDSLEKLQEQLIHDLKNKDISVSNVHQGKGRLQNDLKGCRALIILDDVDSVHQLDALFWPIKLVLHHTSLILITSRDRRVLAAHARIAETSIYLLKGLDATDSKELFCLHAFFQAHPKPGFENVLNGFLRICNGLPLLLRAWGEHPCLQDMSQWEDKSLQDMEDKMRGLEPPLDIEKSFQISYKSLNKQAQNIFLDIACFSIGKNKDTWIRIWRASGWDGEGEFKNLINKCLVEVDAENKIRVLDHLGVLGRSTALKSEPRRLWDASITDVRDLWLKAPSYDSHVRGIRMAPLSSRDIISQELFPSNSGMPFRSSSNQNGLSKLRLFEGEGDFVKTMLTRVQLPELIWLSWNDCSYSCLPSCIPTVGLKILEVAGMKLGRLWQSNFQVPLPLQELNIDAPILEFPKSLKQLEHLEKIVVECSMDEGTQLATLPQDLHVLRLLKCLTLKQCSKLLTIPESLRILTNLQQINFSGCKNLVSLPDSLGDLTNLQHIDLSECGSLSTLPDSLENLSNLQHINLSKCKSLGTLPDWLENLAKLEHIDLSECGSLRMLPISLGNLTNLQRIYLSGCKSLERLPDSFVGLANLRHMDLSQCELLGMLPESFGNLVNLQHIDISECKMLKGLPHSFRKLTNLQYIDLSGCTNLKSLQEFSQNSTNIQDIKLHGCKKLETLPLSIGNLKNLKQINLSECVSLETLPHTFGELTNLQNIDFHGATSLKTVPDSFGKLTKLQYMDFQRCFRLARLPDCFDNLTNLKHINLSSCESLEILPNSFGSLPPLHLDLTKCYTLTISSEPLRKVAKLYLATKLEEFPEDFVCPGNLELLELEGPFLKGLPPSFDLLTSLKKLYLVECKKLECLPNSIGLLTQLEVLEIRNCGIQNLPPDLLNLNDLAHLEICQCPSLCQLPFKNVEGDGERLLTEGQGTPSDRGMRKLKVLHLDGIEISDLSFPRRVCPTLQHLIIRDCKKIAEVGALPRTLSTLELINCGALRKIGGLCVLANLEKLDLSKCNNIKVELLPGLEALTSLKVFRTPLDTNDGRAEETLASILRSRRRWCNCCTEGVLPFLRQFERMAML